MAKKDKSILLKAEKTLTNSKNDNSIYIKELEQSYKEYKSLKTIDKTTNDLSDALSKDLQKRGMKFVGSTIIYSYLQAIGVMYSHDKECYLYKTDGCY